MRFFEDVNLIFTVMSRVSSKYRPFRWWLLNKCWVEEEQDGTKWMEWKDWGQDRRRFMTLIQNQNKFPKNVCREQRHLFQLSLVSESRGRVESETVMVKSSAYWSPINLAQMSHPEEKTIKSQIPSQVILWKCINTFPKISPSEATSKLKVEHDTLGLLQKCFSVTKIYLVPWQ